jgi:hypothetical protein
MNVTYLPSGYVDEQQTRLDELRALVTTAAQYGVFRIEGAKDARRLADQIRLFKRTDPALAIYAVYAYADAVLTEQVLSTQSLLREELHGDLFDVALLADTISGKRIKGQSDVTPFCPLLTQGWQLLRAKNISLPERVELARNDMRDALWTTFGNRGMSSILSEIQSMVIQSPG